MDEIVIADFPEGKVRLKFPDASVVVPIVLSSFAEILTPGNAFPVSSFTVPVMVFCPIALKENVKKANRKMRYFLCGNSVVK